jgi:hypothetical protein
MSSRRSYSNPQGRAFCTLFDVNYVTRAVALYRSLESTQRSFTLRMFCMDDEARRLINGLDLPFAQTISTEELEAHDPALAGVRAMRSPVEYCWTATPAICLYCLETEPDLAEITYLDADLMFFSDCEPLFSELGTNSVLLTSHRFAPKYASWEADAGVYNVQFLTFRATADGLAALRWWHARCLEWCFDRRENGRFGDQKYLDDWTVRFAGVHVLQHPGGGVAPWNSSRERIVASARGLTVSDAPLVFYHCHGLEIYLDRWSQCWCGLITLVARLGVNVSSYRLRRRPVVMGWRTYPGYEVSGSRANMAEHRFVWEAYCRLIGQAYEDVRRIDPAFVSGSVRLSVRDLAFWIVRDAVPIGLRSRLGAVRRRLGLLTREERREEHRQAAVAS